MGKIKQSTQLLVTDAIRKDNLKRICTELTEFPIDEIVTPTVEHFVELEVIINKHVKVYGQRTFAEGVNALMALRDHFNEPNNIYWMSEMVNTEKKDATHLYLQNKQKKPFSPELVKYVAIVCDTVLEHIQATPVIDEVLKDELCSYVVWLSEKSK